MRFDKASCNKPNLLSSIEAYIGYLLVNNGSIGSPQVMAGNKGAAAPKIGHGKSAND